MERLAVRQHCSIHQCPVETSERVEENDRGIEVSFVFASGSCQDIANDNFVSYSTRRHAVKERNSNSLPEYIVSASFQHHLKTFLFRRSFPDILL